LIQNLFSKEYLDDFMLVGGTALALQIGHRKSLDIDLFSCEGFQVEMLLQRLEKDICAMKVNAISVSGRRAKDFIDLYFLLKEYTVSDIIGYYEAKYEQRN